MSVFDTVWASDDDALIDVPSDAEIRDGFRCGPASPGLFNWLFQSLMSAMNDLNIADMVSRFRRVATTEGITGGGDLTVDRTLRLDFDGMETAGAIANDDLVAIYDVSTEAHRKMTRADFVAGLGGGGGGVTGATNIGSGAGELYSGLAADTLEFRSIAAGDGIDVVIASDDVVVSIADMGADLTF